MGENAADAASGVAVNAALEFLQETDDWATNDHTRKVVLRLYQETVGKSPPVAVTNFAWIRLRVAYEITRCRAENEGFEIAAKWHERYEAVKAWDHAKYIELTGQIKVGPPGEESQMRKVKEVKAKAAKKPKAEQGSVEPKQVSGPSKHKGTTLGLTIQRTWFHVLEQNARESAMKNPTIKSDEEMIQFVKEEFPRVTSGNLANIKAYRRAYNQGLFPWMEKKVPTILTPVPEKGPSEKKTAGKAAASAVRKEASTAAKKSKRIRVRKAAKAEV